MRNKNIPIFLIKRRNKVVDASIVNLEDNQHYVIAIKMISHILKKKAMPIEMTNKPQLIKIRYHKN